MKAKCTSYQMSCFEYVLFWIHSLWVLHCLWHKSPALFRSRFLCDVPRPPKGIGSKSPRHFFLLMNALCYLVQHRDWLKYCVALPGDVGFTGLSLERQHIEIWKGLWKGALTDLAVVICESWGQVWGFLWVVILSSPVISSSSLIKKWKLTVTVI